MLERGLSLFYHAFSFLACHLHFIIFVNDNRKPWKKLFITDVTLSALEI
jgi:hypothetical protein